MFGEKENTEEKIMKAAFDILQREGLAKTTTKKIAAEAGVNEVTIFRKFENKKNLMNATKEFYLKKFTDKLEENFDYTEDETVEEYLNKSFYGMLEFEEEDAKIVRVALGEVRENPENKLLISHLFNKFRIIFPHIDSIRKQSCEILIHLSAYVAVFTQCCNAFSTFISTRSKDSLLVQQCIQFVQMAFKHQSQRQPLLPAKHFRKVIGTETLLIGFDTNIRLHHRCTEDQIQFILFKLLGNSTQRANALPVFSSLYCRFKCFIDRYCINGFHQNSPF